jgi:hypothetical protein
MKNIFLKEKDTKKGGRGYKEGKNNISRGVIRGEKNIRAVQEPKEK